MNICENTLLSVKDLASQLAEKLFAAMPEHSPLVVITDQSGKSYNSNEAVFSEVFTKSEYIQSICSRVADGQDMLSTQINGYNIFATQIEFEASDFVCAMIAIPAKQSVINADLAELVFGQTELIAGLIEKQGQQESILAGDPDKAFIYN
jgi:hypothetical protein